MANNYSGNHICEHCNRSFEWEYFNPHRNKISDPIYTVHTYRNGVTLVNQNNGLSNENETVFTCNCPKCDEECKITVTKDN